MRWITDKEFFSVLQAVPSPRPLFSCWAKDFISCNFTYLFLLFPELFRKLLPMIISWWAPFMFSSSRFKFSDRTRKLLIHSVIIFHRAWWFKWAVFSQRPRCLNIFFPGAESVWGRLGGVVLLEEVFPGGGLWESTASPYSQFALSAFPLLLKTSQLPALVSAPATCPHRDGVLSLWKCNPR